MAEEKAEVHIITALDDISWLFNIRANDVECCPVVLSFAAITADKALLFADENACGGVRGYVEANGGEILPYEDIYGYAEKLAGKRVLIDKSRANYRLVQLLEKCGIISGTNPCTLFKAVKNAVEIENIRKAHLMDGIAVTKFMYWLKQNVGKVRITESDAAAYIDGLRREIGGDSFVGVSFETISAYGANAAMVHYSAETGSNAEIKAEGMPPSTISPYYQAKVNHDFYGSY